MRFTGTHALFTAISRDWGFCVGEIINYHPPVSMPCIRSFQATICLQLEDEQPSMLSFGGFVLKYIYAPL